MRTSALILVAACLSVLTACATTDSSAPAPSSPAPTPPSTDSVTPTSTTPPVTRLPRIPPVVEAEVTITKETPKPPPGVPCDGTADACIDLSANQSWLLSDGAVAYGPVPITHGRAGWETPPGTFNVGWKDIDHLSSEFDNAPMPYSVFFNGGIAFHEGSLSDLSHGCIHLSNAAAQTYYDALQVGDVVQVVP
jgi:lipoprotein-anchoring transpeptidase ErfK/SrfK